MSDRWDEPESDWEREAAARIEAERDRHRRNPKPAWEAKAFPMASWEQGTTGAGVSMRRAFGFGVLASVVGSFVYFQSDSDAEVAGLFLWGFGGTLITVAVLAWAVSLGVRHAKELGD